MDTWLAIASKRDVRDYAPAPIPPEVERRILDAGRLSGSSRNRQPWTFVIVRDDRAIEAVAESVFEPGNIRGAAFVVAVVMGAILALMHFAFKADTFAAFLWSGTIGTLILLVAYVLTTIGCVILVFVQRKLPVPMWQIIVPVLALVVLGYTLYRNVIPYPAWGSSTFWLPVVSGGWLLVGIAAVLAAPATARRMGAKLSEMEGIAAAKATPTDRIADSAGTPLLEG